MKDKPVLTVHNGAKRKLEEALLDEFAKPGVGNLRKIRRLGEALKPKGRLTLHERRSREVVSEPWTSREDLGGAGQ